MENPMIKYQTHNVTVTKHVDWVEVGIAMTPEGTVVVFRDIDGMLYAVYSSKKGRFHVHIPYAEDIILLDERCKKVLDEVKQCLYIAECYVMNNIVYNINIVRLRTNQPFGFPPWRSNLLRITTLTPPFPHAKSSFVK